MDLKVEQFAAVAVDTLSWLLDDGYVEVKRRIEAGGFGWRLWSDRARVIVSTTPGRWEVDAYLAPPAPLEATWTIFAPFIGLEGVRHAHGLPVARRSDVFRMIDGEARPPIERFRDYLRGFEDLRPFELAGDWSRRDEAAAAIKTLGWF